MSFVIVLAITIACCFVLRNPISKWPWLFYVLCVAADVLFLAGLAGMLPRSLWLALYVPLRKAMLPLALFVVVMYIGVFPQSGKVSKWLRPIRAELSIMACLLVVGHMASYLGTYLTGIFMGGSIKPNVIAAFYVALILLVLIIVLGVTSFKFVKKRMNAKTWKAVQRWAYPFFLLTYAHLMLVLGKAALAGGAHAVESVVVYTLVFVVYAVARLLRAKLDAKEKQ